LQKILLGSLVNAVANIDNARVHLAGWQLDHQFVTEESMVFPFHLLPFLLTVILLLSVRHRALQRVVHQCALQNFTAGFFIYNCFYFLIFFLLTLFL
jgi:hypothetical protein